MRRTLGAAVLLAGAGAVWLASRMCTEPPPSLPPPAVVLHHLEPRLEFREESGVYVFRVAGTTDVPPETVFRTRLFAVEEVGDFRRGSREDEEPLVYEEDGDLPAWRRFRPADGAFSIDLHEFRRRPYSLHYRARVAYHPKDQTLEVRHRLGEEEVSVTADLRLGSEATLARELRERHVEAQADFSELEGVWKQLRHEIVRQRSFPDPEAWHAWDSIWTGSLRDSERRNRERYALWQVFSERRARMRIGGTAELLRRMIDDQTAILEGDPDRADRLRDRLAMMAEYLEETRDEVGVDLLDPDVFAPLIARYEGALAGLPASRGQALAALLEIAPPLSRRRRAYAFLSDVGDRLARLLEAPGPETRAAHDRTLAAFKSLAGLP